MKLTKCENKHFYDADTYAECPHCGGGAAPKVSTNDEARHIRPTSGVFSTPPVTSERKKGISPTESEDFSSPVEITDTEPLTSQSRENSIMPNVSITPEASIIPEVEIEQQPKDDTLAAISVPVAATAPSLHSQVRAVSAHTQPEDTATVAFYDFPSDVEPVVGWLVCVSGEYFGQSFNLKVGQNFIGRALNMDVPLAKDTKVSRNKHAIITFDPQNSKFFLQPGESSGLTYLNGELLLAPTVIDAYAQIGVGDTKLVFSPFCSEQFSWKDKGEN